MRPFLTLLFFVLFVGALFITPIVPAHAGIIPCGLTTDDPNQTGDQTVKCTLCHLVVGINSIIVFLRNIMSAIAIAVIVAMAFVYITSAGDEGRMRFAKGGIMAALIGFAIILLAWVIVNFILSIRDTSGTSIFNSTLVRTGWDSFQCSTSSVAGTATLASSTGTLGTATGSADPSAAASRFTPTALPAGSVTLTGLPASTTTDTTASITFTPDPGVTAVACSVDGATPTTCPSTLSLQNLSVGQHRVDYFVDTGSGINPSAPSRSYTWNVVASSANTPSTITLEGLPPTSTTTTTASIQFTQTGNGFVFCRLDNFAPIACPNPFVLGASTPLAAGNHTVDYYLQPTNSPPSPASVPTESFSWTVVASAPGPGPGPEPSTAACTTSGVTPLAQLPYSAASLAVDGGGSSYNGVNPVLWNGNVILGPVQDPNGSGRTVNIHRIMQAAPYAWGSTHRAEMLWDNSSYDLPPGVDTWQSFAVMRKPGESQPASSGDDSMLVFQSHTPESGATGPPYELIFARQTNSARWHNSYNPNPPSTWNWVGGPNPDRYDVRPASSSETIPPEGDWYRYIVHYRAGYLASHNPVMEVWRARPGGQYEQLFRYTGPNAYNGGNGYPRIGPYKWDSAWNGQSSYAFYMTPLYYGRGTDLFDEASAALCGL